MHQQQIHRTRAVVERELAAATEHRVHAVADLDMDAYGHLTEQINDLLDELSAGLRPRLT